MPLFEKFEPLRRFVQKSFLVIAAWDADAAVWFVQATDIPGLNVEAVSLDAFEDVVREVAGELIRANFDDSGPGPYQLVIEARRDLTVAA
jgi:hypothetical protein